MPEEGGAQVIVTQYSIGPNPYSYCGELYEIFKLAWPTSVSMLFHYLIQPTCLMFCGHLGKQELAGVAMALSIIYVEVVSVGRGLGFGGDTFFAQTYGSKNKKKVGIYLQTTLIFGVLVSLPIIALLLNTRTLLLLIGQDPAVADIAQEYVMYFTPGVLAYCWLFTLMRYLLCQNRVIPNMIICMIACTFNAILHYGLVFQAQMGIRGSAISLALTYYLVLLMLFSYIWGTGIYRETWSGWSFRCLEDWGEYGRVVSSSIFLTVLFWLCTEIGTYLGGLLGEKQISAFSIMFQVEGFAWMVPLGLGGACTSRLGQYLGANDQLGAINACRVGISIIAIVSVALSGIVYLLKHEIPQAFTSNVELINYTARLMPLICLFLLIEGIGGVGISIIRGTGRQTLGAIVVFISYYVFALPVGIPLMFCTYLGLAGIWWGFILGLSVQCVCLILFVAKLDWAKEAKKAQVRAGVEEPTVTPSSSQPEVDPVGHIQDPCLDEPDESTSLLTSSASSSSLSVSVPRGHTIARRLTLAMVSIATLAAGLLVRHYVQLPITAAPLCIPAINNTGNWTHIRLPSNGSIPFCNNTSSDFMVFPRWL